jgi:UDP-N-acetylenolpyruvoylglucosamine reductase
VTTFAELTTMQVGGEPARLVEATTTDELLAAVREASLGDDPWFVLGGGSNTVASDEPFDGTVVRVATRGVERVDSDDDRVHLRVAAGEPWDDLVAYTVERGWSGLEALSGIPGSTGASPIQNIGAYGQEVASTLVAVDFLDDERLQAGPPGRRHGGRVRPDGPPRRERAGGVPAAREGPRRRARSPGLGGRRAVQRAGPAGRQGHGARPRRP